MAEYLFALNIQNIFQSKDIYTAILLKIYVPQLCIPQSKNSILVNNAKLMFIEEVGVIQTATCNKKIQR